MLVLHTASLLTQHLLGSTSTSRRALPETSKKGAKRVKSPKSKSPAPTSPILPPAPETGPIVEGGESHDPVRLLKGHDTEVRHVRYLTWLLTESGNSLGLRLCMEPRSSRRADFGVSPLFRLLNL